MMAEQEPEPGMRRRRRVELNAETRSSMSPNSWNNLEREGNRTLNSVYFFFPSPYACLLEGVVRQFLEPQLQVAISQSRHLQVKQADLSKSMNTNQGSSIPKEVIA